MTEVSLAELGLATDKTAFRFLGPGVLPLMEEH
jgi:hypothetical protein